MKARENIGRHGLVIMALALISLLVGCGGGSGSDSASGSSGVGVTTTYNVSGTISGLKSGVDLTIQNNAGDDFAINGDGGDVSFTFSTAITNGDAYGVTVLTQPSTSDAFCTVYNSQGSLDGSDITDVTIKCTDGLYNLVDTDQSVCYDSTNGAEVPCVGDGYDADYDGNQPDYTLSADGTIVTDNVTGLIWTQTPDIDDNGIVDVDDKLILSDAESYCSNLSTSGFDWRLPDIKELYSLMQFSGGDPSSYSGTDTSILTPFIDDSVFTAGFGDTDGGERLIDGQYATTSVYTSPEGTLYGAGTLFGVNFVDGRIKGYPYDWPSNDPKQFYVQCVAGNTSYGDNDFTDNNDQTISDAATGLMWQQDDYQSINFEDAISYCEASTVGSHSDWRLPNIKELQSIVDYSRAPDSTSSAAIDSIFNATAITNEEGVMDWGFYWASTTHANYTGDGTNATYLSFGRALGYFDSAMTDVHGAGAQRSNHKSDVTTGGSSSTNLGAGTFYYHGPQGDILRLDNMVRCVTDDVR